MFAQICRRTQDQICNGGKCRICFKFAPIRKSGDNLIFFQGISRGSKHDIKTDILKQLCQSGKCVQSIDFALLCLGWQMRSNSHFYTVLLKIAPHLRRSKLLRLNNICALCKINGNMGAPNLRHICSTGKPE